MIGNRLTPTVDRFFMRTSAPKLSYPIMFKPIPVCTNIPQLIYHPTQGDFTNTSLVFQRAATNVTVISGKPNLSNNLILRFFTLLKVVTEILASLPKKGSEKNYVSHQQTPHAAPRAPIPRGSDDFAKFAIKHAAPINERHPMIIRAA